MVAPVFKINHRSVRERRHLQYEVIILLAKTSKTLVLMTYCTTHTVSSFLFHSLRLLCDTYMTRTAIRVLMESKEKLPESGVLNVTQVNSQIFPYLFETVPQSYLRGCLPGLRSQYPS